MKKYERPSLEVIEFDAVDVICTSEGLNYVPGEGDVNNGTGDNTVNGDWNLG